MSRPIAGDFDYEAHGAGYAVRRRTDQRIAAYVHKALGDARSVVNVGAGAGSYEPDDRQVTAVEPSRSRRAPSGPPGWAPRSTPWPRTCPFRTTSSTR